MAKDASGRYQVTSFRTKIPDDEPVLVIRGQDVLAQFILNAYILKYQDLADYDPRVIDELRIHQMALTEWQLKNRVKVADR